MSFKYPIRSLAAIALCVAATAAHADLAIVSDLSGYVYVDQNDNGLFDNGDTTLGGVALTLTGADANGDALSLTTTTQPNGYYLFHNVPQSDGNGYTITEAPTPPYLENTNNPGSPYGGTWTPGTDAISNIVFQATFDQDFNIVFPPGTNYNFGEIPPASISGYNYIDADNDGVFEGGETPIVGTTMTLTGVNDQGTIVNLTTTTGVNGFYSFTGLRPGTYTVTETQNTTPPYDQLCQGKNTAGTGAAVTGTAGVPGNDTISGVGLSVGNTAINYNFGEVPPPGPFSVTGGGSYCSGGSGVLVGLSGSESGVNYQLDLNGSPVGSPVGGTGSAISFGNQTAAGTYTVIAANASTGCSAGMTGSATVTVNPLPGPFNVTGGGSYCSGGSGVVVGLSGSESGVNYQLDLNGSPVGSPVAGTGAAISFGNQTAAGTYTVVAANASTGCSAGMTGSVTVTVNPLPSVNVNSQVICAGGSATLTATTSAASPSYLWSPGGATTASITVSPASTTTYTVTVTDGTTTCANSGSGTVTVNPLPSVSVNSHVICAGGSATLTATSSAASPSYVWSPGGATTASITVSPSSTTTYTVTVTDGVTSCANSGSGTVTVNPLPTVSVNSQVICAGGSATLTATTSAASPSYLWSPGGATTALITVSPSSTTTYTVTVTDGVTSCANSGSGTVTVNPLPTVSVNSQVICAGGSATLTATTSAATPSYLWSPGGATTASINVLPTSTITYTVTVTDGTTSCANSGSGTVTVNPAPVLTIDTTNQTACVGSEVTWSVAATGSGLAYQWQRDGTNLVEGVGGFIGTTNATLTNSAVSLADSATAEHGYDCVVSIGSCSATSTGVALTVNPLPSVSVNSAAICVGASAMLTATTSAANPSYLWSPGGATSASITVSPASTTTYTVVVTDGTTSCANSGSGTVTVNPLPSLSLSETDVTCYGGSDGTVTATFGDGTGPYMLSIDGGGFSAATSPQTFTGLSAGPHNVTVQDANTCAFTTSTVVGQPVTAVTIGGTSKSDVACKGASTGSITVAASGGTGTLMYSKDSGASFQAGNVFTGLAAGTYNIVVKDANGCTAGTTVFLSEPATAVTIGGTSKSDVACKGASTGSITVTASGGTGTLMFSKDSGASFQAGNVFSGLAAGTYNIVVKDANGCTAGTTVVLSEPATAVTIGGTSKSDVACKGASTGSITVTASGGTGTLMYSKDSGASFQAGNVFTGLAAGTYNIVVKDANGCTAGTTVFLSEPATAVTIGGTSKSDVACKGASTGSITVTASGGTGTLMFSKDSGASFQAGNVFSGLAAGTYNIVVKDANGCTAGTTVVLSEPATAVTIGGTSKSDVACKGASTGSITVTASGGTGTLMYSKDSGATFQAGNVFSGLAARTYNIVVKDANGCTVGTSVTVGEPATAVTISGTSKSDVACKGGSTGSITVTASGGTGTLMYSKDSGASYQAGNVFNGLAAGTYNIVVKDANGCTVGTSVTVGEPATAVTIGGTSKTDVACKGGSTGSITVAASGGTGTLTYSKNSGASYQAGNVFNGLAAGTYNIVVKDANGCTAGTSVTVGEPAMALALALTETDVTCHGNDGTVTATFSGGTQPYSISIDGGAPISSATSPKTFSGLAAGAHTVMLTDAHSCTAGASTTINVNCPLTLACPGGAGQVGVAYASVLAASGGTLPYTNYAIISGSLPSGLTLNPSTGAITGTPTTAGAFSFTAQVTDSAGTKAIATCSGSGCSSVATWNFSAPSGVLGTSQAYTVNGLTITAYGFTNTSTPAKLYGKNDGGDENGVGINGTLVNEITTSTYIQLDLANVIAAGAANPLMIIGSVQSGEGYNIYGSSTLGSLGSILLTNGTADFTPFTMPGYPANRFIAVRASAVDVLLDALSFSLPGACTITVAPPACTASVCGTLYRDCNADGANYASGDAVLVNVPVTLKNGANTVASTISDGNGSYCFGNLTAGTYTVVVTPPANYFQTYDPDGTKNNQTSVTLTNCQNRTGVNFGYSGSAPSVVLNKTGPQYAIAGQVITYTFAFTNTGNTCFYGGLQVNDPMFGGQIFYQTPVTPGQGFVITKTYTVKSSDPAKLINTATAIGHPPTGNAVSVTSIWSVITVPAPSPCSATPGSGKVSLSWGAVSGASSYNVKRATTSGGPYTTIKSGLTTTTYSDTSVGNGNAYYYVLSAIKSGIEGPNSAQVVSVPTGGLLSPWSTKDIGSVAATGGAGYASGVFTVAGSGVDIWGTADEFRYVYQSADTVCSIVARVASVQNTDPWAKAGIMIRDTLNNNATEASIFVTPGNGITAQARLSTGATTSNTSFPGLTAPYWLKLTRNGNTFTGYYSATGTSTSWTLIGSQTITMGSSVYIGLGVTSHNDGVLSTATFDNVTGTP